MFHCYVSLPFAVNQKANSVNNIQMVSIKVTSIANVLKAIYSHAVFSGRVLNDLK